MHIKKAKIPTVFLEALSRPPPNKQANTKLPSQVEQLRSKLAAHYQFNDSKSSTLTEKQDTDGRRAGKY